MDRTPTARGAERARHRRREPLKDGAAIANIASIPPAINQKQKPQLRLDNVVPKNESLVGNGTFTVRHTIHSPKNRRVSQISSEGPSESKRSSAISTASTNASGTPRKRKTHIGPWQLGSTVGKGGTARVRKVRHAETGQIGVAKIVPIAVAERARAMSLANLVLSAERGDPTLHCDRAIPLGLEREIAIMKLLNHPNIVRLFDVWENRNEIYLIMEFVQGGELFDYINERQRLPEDVTVYLFRQIIWALKHCHSLNIHHRDLKPENILLDHETMTVKLADFGMAALQPVGNFLTTPCGSPHYAAPELLQNLPYDGSQADVWSAGVVLFVMLTGYPPFNFPPDPHDNAPEDHKLKGLFQAISRADYRMPSALSLEAKDLIRRIFVPDPSKRITVDEVWQHSFLHKYDNLWDFETLAASNSMGLFAMAEDNWKPLKAKHIDHDIFRALRTLWHSESDTVLTKKLCSKEFNQEKFFYYTMLCYRQTNIENMHEGASSFHYSASDHQHLESRGHPSFPKSSPSQSTVTSKHNFSKSEYSITGNEHLLSQHSYYDLPESEASYDPFRASLSPMVNQKSEHANVTIHRMGSKGSRRQGVQQTSRGNSLRIELLRANSRHESRISSKHSSAGGNSLRRELTGKRSTRSSSSRMSAASSHVLGGSPLHVIRPSEVHKRGVQFSHVRKSSTSSALPSIADAEASNRTPAHRARALKHLASARSSSVLTSSPPVPADRVVRSKKRPAILPTPRTKKYKEHADLEARKVSAELGKVCDEAFWRSSESSILPPSSLRSTSAEKPLVDTPPSSVSRPSPDTGPKEPFQMSESIRNRPLPPTPVTTRSTLHPLETPVTYTARELTEMRDRLAVKYAREGASNQRYFNDILRQLDNLMEPIGKLDNASEGRRINSAPPDCQYVRGSIDRNSLDVIPEEGKIADGNENANQGQRGLGHASGAWSGNRRRPGDRITDTTIRIVAPSPPRPPIQSHTHTRFATTPWAPLNIRKQSTSDRSSLDARSVNMAQNSNNQQTPGPSSNSFLYGNPYGEHHPGNFVSWGADGEIRERFPYPPPERPENIPHHPTALDHPQRIASLNAVMQDRPQSISEEYFAQEAERVARMASTGLNKITTIPEEEDVIESVVRSAPTDYRLFPETHPQSPFQDDRTTTRDARMTAMTAETPEASKKKSLKDFFKFGKTKKAEESDLASTAKGKGPAVPKTEVKKKDGSSALMVHRTAENQKDISQNMEINRIDVAGFVAKIREIGFLPFMKPLMHVIPINASRPKAWKELSTKFGDAVGFEVLKVDPSNYTVTIKCHGNRIEGLRRNVTFDVEIFAISRNDSPVKLSIVRIVQRSGPASGLKKILREIHVTIDGQGLAVLDPDQAASMKAALFDGLKPRIPGTHVTSENSFEEV